MTQRTRYFLIVSALLVAVGLGTGLVAYYNGAAGANVAAAEMAYVPSNATALAYADVRAIMNSELRQRLRQMMPSGDQRDRLETELGLDLERDIDTVLAGYTGGQTAEGGVILVRGRFDDDMIETKAVQHGATVETYRGKRLILSPQNAVKSGELMPRDGSAPAGTGVTIVPGLAFVEPGLLAFGDAATLRKAIDAAADKVNVTGNADLMRHVSDVQGTGNAWFITKFDAVASHESIPTEIRGQLPQLQWVSASANVTGGVTGTIKAEARDDKAASDLHAVITGGLAAARLMGGQDQRLQALVNSVQVMGAGKNVSVTFALQPELFDLLGGIAASTATGRGGLQR